MKKTMMLLTLASSLLVTANVYAEKEKSPWTSSIELGVINTTGNTKTQTTAAKADVTYEVDKWRHNGHAEAYGSSSEDVVTGKSVTSAERYLLAGKSDYKFTELDYAFGLVKLQKDLFSGFEYEYVVALGYGRKLIKQADMELDVEIGPGVRFYKVDNGVSDEEALLRLAGKYWWAISEHSKFTQDLIVEIGEELTSTTSVTGLQANINSALAMKLTFTAKNKSEVPVGIKETDTETALTLVYNF